jgi:alpha,alpha-trehalose phosphorylase (configuration-retaining)
MHLNAIPFLIRPSTMLFNNLPDPSPEYYAQAALSRAIKELHPAIHSALLVGTDPHTHEVLVDAGNLVHIANLMEYQDSTSPELWRRFMALVRHVKKRNIKVIFASATPSGGGVALMR